MLRRAAATTSKGLLCSQLVPRGSACGLPSLIHDGRSGQRRGHCGATRPLRCASSTPAGQPHHSIDENDSKLLSSQVFALATHIKTEDADTMKQGPVRVLSSSRRTINDNITSAEQRVMEMVKRLQRLASHHTRVENLAPPDDETNVDVSADSLADLMLADASTFPSGTTVGDSANAKSEDVHRGQPPAWEVGLKLAEGEVESPAVAEWLLFLCLRSRDGIAGAPAPLEVCEGVYQMWRQRREAAANAARTQHSTDHTKASADKPEASAPPSSFRSPFAPKGVHHHYATWLLHEFHSAHRVLHEMHPSAPIVMKVARTPADETEESVVDLANNGTMMDECNDVEVVHHACFVLNRALEVLLLDLPHDDAVAALLAGPSTSHRIRRSSSASASFVLRPTTALLVLEASRQLAQMLMEQQHHRSRQTVCTAAFPFLVFLSTPDVTQTNTEGGSKRGFTESVAPLADVARAAFEVVLRAAPPSTNAAAAPHSLQSDALVLYLGVLMASSPLSSLTSDNVDRFVCGGSLTARQLSQQKMNPKVPEAMQQSTTSTFSVDDHVLASVAAAVRSLLSRYLHDVGRTTSNARAGQSEEGHSAHQQRVMNAFAAHLLQRIPLSLQSSFPVSDLEDASSAERQRYGGRGSDLPHESAPHKRPARRTAWCAWLLHVLLCDLERVGRTSATATLAATAAPSHQLLFDSHTSCTALHNETDVKARWERQSAWTIAMTTRLLIVLQQQQQHFSSSSIPHPKRSAVVDVRRVLQEVWRLVFHAALQGSFFHVSLDEDDVSSTLATHAPRFLVQLCYPYYDKTQWRAPSVNLYVRLLDQWGQGERIRQMFAAIARHEADFQADVQAAVAAEQAEASALERKEEEEKEDGERREPSSSSPSPSSASTSNRSGSSVGARPTSRVFRRYHPALNLHSCLLTLRYCGCPSRVLAALTTSHETKQGVLSRTDGNSGISEAEDEDNGALRYDSSFSSAVSSARRHAQAASDARLAGEVLQYMLCALHVVERNAFRIALHGDLAASATSEATEGKSVGATADTLMSEGYPIAQWVEWVGQCAVPAVAQLYQNAGLEEEWNALGY